jgi:hypothetical protein
LRIEGIVLVLVVVLVLDFFSCRRHVRSNSQIGIPPAKLEDEDEDEDEDEHDCPFPPRATRAISNDLPFPQKKI